MANTRNLFLQYDASNGNILPTLTSGLPLNLPAGTTLGGSSIGGLTLSGATLNHVIVAASATTIQDSGTALSSLQTTTGTLALGGFGSITGGLSSFPKGSYAYRDVIGLVNAEVDDRLSGQTAGTSSQNLYSTLNNAGSGTYVRSSTQLAADVDLTGISVFNDGALTATQPATLISPRHVVMAHHSLHANGTVFRFVTNTNTVVTRTLSSHSQISGTDIEIGLLDSDVPSTIKFFKVFTAANELLASTGRAFFTDQNQKLFAGYATLPASTTLSAITQIVASPQSTFWKSGGGVVGDSSHPVFAVVDAQPVLLFVLHVLFSTTSIRGDSIAQSYTAINSAMTSLGGGYQLTPVKITSISAATETIPNALNALSSNTTLQLIDGASASVYFDGPGALTMDGVTSFTIDATGKTAFRSGLGLVIGTDVQAYDADLTTWAGITPATNVGAWIADPTVAKLKTALSNETAVTGNLLSLADPGAITFLRINADNTVDTLSASSFRTAIGAGTGGGDALVANPLSQFAATTSAQLAGVLSDETGFSSGALSVFSINPTLTGATISGGALTLSGNQSAAAWTTSGLRLVGTAGTLTDTTSSGTVAAAYTNKLGGNTIAASSATTFTNYISSYFSDPVAGTNVTLTNKYALGADSVRFGTSNQLTISLAGVLTATSPVFTTPAIGVATGTSLAVNGNITTSAGMIGIGATSPVSQLHVTSDAATSTRGLAVDQHSTGVQGALVNFRKSRGTLASPTTVADGDYNSAFFMQNHDGTDYQYNAGFGSIINGSVSTNNVPADLFFFTSATTDTDPIGNSKARLRIYSNGGVRIGNTSSNPGANNLSVLGTISGGSTISAVTGYQINGAATSGNYLRGNGTNFVSSAIQAADVIAVGAAPVALFVHYADVTSTHTDGTEDDLYTDTIAAGRLANNGESIEEVEHVQFVSSATAARRLKKYFGGTLIFDSGSLTLTLGGDFTLTTMVIRESSSVVRCDVAATSTSASTVPYSTYTRITGLTLANTQIIKSTGIASGTGALSGDIIDKMGKIGWVPAP